MWNSRSYFDFPQDFFIAKQEISSQRTLLQTPVSEEIFPLWISYFKDVLFINGMAEDRDVFEGEKFVDTYCCQYTYEIQINVDQ
jgi:hypothetical protein